MSELPPDIPEKKPDRKLLGEPVTRQDGVEIKIYKTDRGLEVDAGWNAYYSDDEVEYLGGGNWNRGFARISQSYYKDPEISGPAFKNFIDEIRQARESGLLDMPGETK